MALGTFWIPSGCDLTLTRTKEVEGADAGRLRPLEKGQGVAERLCKTPSERQHVLCRTYDIKATCMHVYMCHFHHAQKLIIHTRSTLEAVALWMSAAIVDSTQELLLVPVCVFFVTNSTQRRKEFREEKLPLRIRNTRVILVE
jgi:hypothetical protein